MKRTRLTIVLLALALLSGTLLVVHGLDVLREALVTSNLYFYEFLVNRGSVEGRVTARRAGNDGEQYAAYQYTVDSPFTGEDRIDGAPDGLDSLKVGDPVEVIYVNGLPNISRIAGTIPHSEHIYQRYAFPVVFFFASGSALLLVTLAAGITVLWSRLTAAHDQ